MLKTKTFRTGLLAVALIGALAGGAAWWRMRQGSAQLSSDAASSRYADPAVCEQCHGDIAATYKKTGMGRAFSRVRTADDMNWPASGKPWHHAASDTFFEMVQRDGSWFQRRWQIGFDGQQTNVDEKRVDYVLGSGNHAKSFLHLTENNTLQELPLGWYAEKGGYWAMNPGYDRPDYAGSIRPIYYDCMACHNGYPKIPEGEHKDVTQSNVSSTVTRGHRLPTMPRARTEPRRQGLRGRVRGCDSRGHCESGPLGSGSQDGGLPPVPSRDLQ